MDISLLADHPQESDKIAKWYYDEWARIAPNVTLETVQNSVRDKSKNRTTIPLSLVAHHKGILVGTLELKYRENKHYPEYLHWLGGVFVEPPYRQRGIASELITEAKNTALNLGVNLLYLQCETHNVQFYLKHDFVVLHQARHHEIEITIMVWCAAT